MWPVATGTIGIFEKFCIGREVKNGVTIAQCGGPRFNSLAPRSWSPAALSGYSLVPLFFARGELALLTESLFLEMSRRPVSARVGDPPGIQTPTLAWHSRPFSTNTIRRTRRAAPSRWPVRPSTTSSRFRRHNQYVGCVRVYRVCLKTVACSKLWSVFQCISFSVRQFHRLLWLELTDELNY
jgi:hypothetical protein